MNQNLFENMYYTPPLLKSNAKTPIASCKSLSQTSNKRLSFSSQKKKRNSLFPGKESTPSQRDEQLQKLFSNTSKFNSSYEKNSRSSTTYSALSQKISEVCIDDVENIPPKLTRMLPQEKSSLSNGFLAHTPPNNVDCTNESNNKNITPKQNPMYDRIRRDLNSPSAGVRIRALKALKYVCQICIFNFYHYNIFLLLFSYYLRRN